MPGGRPLKFNNVEELESMIDSYFIECDQSKKPYSITGLAVWLDTSRETLINYEERPEFFDTIKRAKVKCENWVEEGALMNRINATSAIFNLKNNYGWKDKTEVEQKTDITSGGEKITGMIIQKDEPTIQNEEQ
jgi:phage-related protein